jgi:hypothetical protein
MTVVGQVLQLTSELDQIMQAAFSAQGRVLIAQRAEPAQEMGVTAQLGELAHFGERRVEIGEETVGCASIVAHGVRAEGGGEYVEVSVKNLLQAEGAAAHGVSGEDKRTR